MNRRGLALQALAALSVRVRDGGRTEVTIERRLYESERVLSA